MPYQQPVFWFPQNPLHSSRGLAWLRHMSHYSFPRFHICVNEPPTCLPALHLSAISVVFAGLHQPVDLGNGAIAQEPIKTSKGRLRADYKDRVRTLLGGNIASN
ncbi:hypothetical protein CC2G_014676 [Coprinopsis cinerea AmutBmut pab1-1]|nr:hypothetical protein CC2G_014676 [Coprinopsis cinerea AmutBmut pab1-1]